MQDNSQDPGRHTLKKAASDDYLSPLLRRSSSAQTDILYEKLLQEVRDFSILLLDPDGNILNWNQGAAAIKGYAAEDIIGENFRIFYPGDDRAIKLPEALLKKAITTGRASHDGWRLKKDGSKFWGSVVITALHDDDGNVLGFSKLTRDLTERKIAEEKKQLGALDLAHKNEQLRQSEERYHLMISEIEDYAIILLSPEGTIMNWNKGAEKIKGYSSEEIIGRNFSVFYLKEDLDRGLPHQLISHARKEGKANHEGWRVKKDGTTFWSSVVITALHDAQKNIIGFTKVTRDLTELKNARERQERYTVQLRSQNEMLRQSEERYHRMILEVEDYAIILLDVDGLILNWNKGAEKIKGYREEEIIGQNFTIFYPPEVKDFLPQQLLSEAAAKNKAQHEGWRVRKDGSRFWGSIVITALHDDNGKVIGFSKVTRDLTQKKEAEDFIQKQNKQLEEFAYITSHDLQEPVRKIRMFGEMAADNLHDNQKASMYIDKIRSATDRMTSLISSILQYTQVNVQEDLKQDVDLNQIIFNILDDFELLLQQKNATVTYESLPTVKGIPIQLHQLFANLISNAIKYNERDPQIKISSELLPPHLDSRQFFRILVSDNGIGFDEEYLGKMFQMFQRLHSNYQGAGIGLALCKKIVDEHGGSITAYSKPGEGSVFEINFPA